MMSQDTACIALTLQAAPLPRSLEAGDPAPPLAAPANAPRHPPRLANGPRALSTNCHSSERAPEGRALPHADRAHTVEGRPAKLCLVRGVVVEHRRWPWEPLLCRVPADEGALRLEARPGAFQGGHRQVLLLQPGEERPAAVHLFPLEVTH